MSLPDLNRNGDPSGLLTGGTEGAAPSGNSKKWVNDVIAAGKDLFDTYGNLSGLLNGNVQAPKPKPTDSFNEGGKPTSIENPISKQPTNATTGTSFTSGDLSGWIVKVWSSPWKLFGKEVKLGGWTVPAWLGWLAVVLVAYFLIIKKLFLGRSKTW